MSYYWETNGNDLNWEMMEFLSFFNEDFEIALFKGEIETDEEGNISDEVYDSYSDGNPTIIYYKGDVEPQELLKEGKKLDDVLDWYIVHNTNSNSVSLVGDVPDEYLTDEYIAERNESEGA